MHLTKLEIIDKIITESPAYPVELALALCEAGEVRKIGFKQIVFEIGQKCRNLFFVLDGGFVYQFSHSETGNTKTISFHLPDFRPWVGSADSFFFNSNNKYRLKAIKESYVLVIKKEEIDKITAINPIYLRWLNEKIRDLFMDQLEISSNHIVLSSKEMYLHILKRYPQITKQIPSKYIAEFLGITREHFSRIRRDS